METDSSYTAEAALSDVAETRTRTRATELRWPVWYHLPIIAVVPVASLGFVASPPWRYLLPVGAIALATAVAFYFSSVMDRRGAHVRTLQDLSKAPVVSALMLLGALVYVATLPLTDVNGWSPWTVPAVGLAFGLLSFVLILRLNATSARREAPEAGPGGDQ